MHLIEYFDVYVSAGLKIIPVYPCSKIPIGKDWNNNWNRDNCRNLFRKFPECNMGLLLGEIIDIEGDDEKANELLYELTEDVEHPTYRSSKSIHHLFLNPDPNLTRLQFNNIEFRAHAHQSVVPPSLHYDNTPYLWLKGTKFPIPPMPQKLLDYYYSLKEKSLLKPNHIKPRCNICKRYKFIHSKRYALEIQIFKSLGYKWMCQKCRDVDIRPQCRELRKKSIYNNYA